MDAVSALIGSAGVIIAGLTFYLTRLKKAKIDVFAAPMIHVYHPKDGGAAIYLPTTFYNKSGVDGGVLKFYVGLRSPNGNTYYLRCREFTEYFWRTDTYKHLQDAEPFVVGSRAYVTKLLWFHWPENEVVPFDFIAGDYELSLQGWSTNSANPDITHKQEFRVSQRVAGLLEKRKAARDPKSWRIPFEEHRNIGFFVGDVSSDGKPWLPRH